MNAKKLNASNIIDLTAVRFKKDLANLRFLTIYAVRANALTGDWIEEPYPTNEAISSETWSRQEDTAHIHFTTFTHYNPKNGDAIVSGLMVNWVTIDED